MSYYKPPKNALYEMHSGDTKHPSTGADKEWVPSSSKNTKLHLKRKGSRPLRDPDILLSLGESGTHIPLLWDSSNIHFRFTIFLKEFILHMAYPVCFYYGNPCHQFFNPAPGAIMVNWIFPLLLRLAVVSWWFCTFDLEGGVAIPMLLYTIHRCMIALKYATFSETEYDRYQTCPEGEVLQEYINQAHLLSGWGMKNPAVIEYEISSAAARAGAPLGKLKLYLSDTNIQEETQKWNHFLAESFGTVKQETKMGQVRSYVSLREACIALPTAAYNAPVVLWAGTQLERLTFFYTIVNVAIPLMRPGIYREGADNLWMLLYYVSSSCVIMMFSVVLMSFLKSVVLATLRMYVVAESLKEMLEFTEPLLLNNMKCGMKAMNTAPSSLACRNPFDAPVAFVQGSPANSRKHRTNSKTTGDNIIPRVNSAELSRYDGHAADLSPSVTVERVRSRSNSQDARDPGHAKSTSLDSAAGRESRSMSRTNSVHAVVAEGVDAFDTGVAPTGSGPPTRSGSMSGKRPAVSRESSLAKFDWLRDVYDVDVNSGGLDRLNNEDKDAAYPDSAGDSDDESSAGVTFADSQNEHSTASGQSLSQQAPLPGVVDDRALRGAVAIQRRYRGFQVRKEALQRTALKKVDATVDDTALSMLKRNTHRFSDLVTVPKISVHTPDNIYGWLYARSVMQNYGARIRFRMDGYVGCISLLLFALMVFVVVYLSVAEDRVGMINNTLVKQALLAVLVVTIYVTGVVFTGALANWTFDTHRMTVMQLYVLCKKGVEDLQQKLTYVSATETDLYVAVSMKKSLNHHLNVMGNVADACGTALESLELSNELQPIRILGYRSEYSMCFTIVTTIISFFVYVSAILFE